MSLAASLIVGFLTYMALLAGIGFFCRVSNASGDQLILGDRKLNHYLLGIAGMSAANSGFIMTGAVGSGYTNGLSALLLPLAWLIGDLIFWRVQPAKLNALARQRNARSIPALLSDSGAGWTTFRRVLGTLIILVALLYSCSQFVASAKILASFTHISLATGVALTFGIISFICISGGFRSTLWTDIVQGLMMVVTTVVVLVTVAIAWPSPTSIGTAFALATPTFSSLFGSMSIIGVVGFVGGWASAAFGFSLSQPHLVLMYMAGRSPKDTLRARWIYISLVQFTWIGMTLLGVFARLMLGSVSDPEATLAVFTLRFCGPLVAVVILSGAFSAVGSTVDALVVSSAGTAMDDVFRVEARPITFRILAFLFVALSALLVTVLRPSVFDIAILAVSLLACTVGPVVMLRLALPTVSPRLASGLLFANLGIFVAWHALTISSAVNETLPAFALGTAILIFKRASRRQAHD